MLLQEAVIHCQAPGICLELLPIRLQIAQQLAQDDVRAFIDQRLHGECPVAHVEGICGLGQDPPDAQGGVIIERP